MSIKRSMCFKELAHMIVGASKCDTCRVGQQAEILGTS